MIKIVGATIYDTENAIEVLESGGKLMRGKENGRWFFVKGNNMDITPISASAALDWLKERGQLGIIRAYFPSEYAALEKA